MNSNKNEPDGKATKWYATPKWQRRLKLLGAYSFLFFLIKGLLWLIIPLLLIYFGWDAFSE